MTESPIALRLWNDSKHRGKNHWTWRVWVEGEDASLDLIDRVQYVLHPTFPKPVQIVDDRDSKFMLRGQGWGEFEIRAAVELSDGRRIDLDRWLEFAAPPLEERETPRARVSISHSLADGPLANLLAPELLRRDYDVTAWGDASAEEGVAKLLEKAIDAADLNVVFISDTTSDSFASEAAYALESARKRKARILAVVVGKATIPAELAELRTVRISSATELTTVADEVEAMLKEDPQETP